MRSKPDLVWSMLQLHVAKCRPRQEPLRNSRGRLRRKRARVVRGQRRSWNAKGSSCMSEVTVMRQQAFMIWEWGLREIEIDRGSW